jgi:spore coat polysaccharide biosynthesis protein SpsF
MYSNRNEKILATIEARIASTRLPGKVLLPLAGRPVLERQIERIRRSRYVDDVIVATTTNRQDEAIVKLCERIRCKFYRGSEDDVLQRVLDSAYSAKGDIIVELTGDCPLIDHRHIDKIIEIFYSGDYDYASNVVERSFPDGFDVQVFPVSVLEEVDRLTDDPIDRVHVSYYIYMHPERFRITNWKAEGRMYWPDLRVTLDERSDYELLNIIFEGLVGSKPDFSAVDVVNFLLERPELLKVNAEVRTKDVEEG